MTALRCRLSLHHWPDVWTKFGERRPINHDGLWFEVFEKRCLRPMCAGRITLDGPLRHSKSIGGDISDVNWM